MVIVITDLILKNEKIVIMIVLLLLLLLLQLLLNIVTTDKGLKSPWLVKCAFLVVNC